VIQDGGTNVSVLTVVLPKPIKIKTASERHFRAERGLTVEKTRALQRVELLEHAADDGLTTVNLERCHGGPDLVTDGAGVAEGAARSKTRITDDCSASSDDSRESMVDQRRSWRGNSFPSPRTPETGEADQNLLTGDVEFMSSAGRGGVSANAVMQETLDGPNHDAHVKLDAGDAIRGARKVRPKWFVSKTASAPLRPQSRMGSHEIGGKRQRLVNIQTGCDVDGPTPSGSGSVGGGNKSLVRQVVSENGNAIGKKCHSTPAL
jgi:hypothetical protein